MSNNSSQRILRSTAITGGASIVNLIFGLVRTKVVAILLGPSGIGLLGLYSNLVTTISIISSVGLVNAGTREAARIGDTGVARLQILRRTLTTSMLVTGVLGGLLFWAFSEPVLAIFSHSEMTSSQLAWLALGVFLTTSSGAQIAIINGMRRIDLLAKITISTSIVSTGVGIAAILVFQRQGIVFFVLAGPAATLLLGQYYVLRLGRRISRAAMEDYIKTWKGLVKVGSSFMFASLLAPIGQLVARATVQRQLGSDALGYFHAAVVFSTVYTSLVLNAMAADFFPALSATIHDPRSANKMVNSQTEIALLLISPVLIAVMGGAPWLIDAMYSHQFAEAVKILRWQILGDILKISAWPIGFILLASGDARAILVSECAGTIVYCLLVWLGLRYLGIEATGIAYLGMYLAYIPLVYFIARKKTDFRWPKSILLMLGVLIFATFSLLVLGAIAPIAGACTGSVLALILGIYGLRRLQALDALPRGFDRFVRRVRTYLTGS